MYVVLGVVKGTLRYSCPPKTCPHKCGFVHTDPTSTCFCGTDLKKKVPPHKAPHTQGANSGGAFEHTVGVCRLKYVDLVSKVSHLLAVCTRFITGAVCARCSTCRFLISTQQRVLNLQIGTFEAVACIHPSGLDIQTRKR